MSLNVDIGQIHILSSTLSGPAQETVVYGLCDSSTLDEVKFLESGSK